MSTSDVLTSQLMATICKSGNLSSSKILLLFAATVKTVRSSTLLGLKILSCVFTYFLKYSFGKPGKLLMQPYIKF